MIKVTEILQVLSDTTRLRLLKLLSEEELSVAELQEILEMGQSRISTHLSQIRRHGLLSDRKDGKKTFYSLLLDDFPRLDLIRVALREDLEEEFWESDRAGLTRIIDRRRRESERYFDEVAVTWVKLYTRSFLGCDWSFPSQAGASDQYRRLGSRGRNDIAITCRKAKRSFALIVPKAWSG